LKIVMRGADKEDRAAGSDPPPGLYGLALLGLIAAVVCALFLHIPNRMLSARLPNDPNHSEIDVRDGSMLSKKSRIEPRRKSREIQFLAISTVCKPL